VKKIMFKKATTDPIDWSVNSTRSSVNANGLLTIAVDEIPGELTVTAAYRDVAGVSGIATVTVTGEPIDNPTITFIAYPGMFRNQTDATRNIVLGGSAGELPRMPMMNNPGYRFMGWEDEHGSVRRDGFTIDRDITLTAGWEPSPVGFQIGDTNRNGRVTSADATAIARWLISSPEERENMNFCSFAADITGTGYVTIDDIVLLARWLVGHEVDHLIAK